MYICKVTGLATMLSSFNKVLQTAADVLAPPPTPLQDFKYHWKLARTKYDTEQSVKAVKTAATTDTAETINDTNAPRHMDEMLNILMREEEDNRTSSDAAEPTTTTDEATVLEYFLNKRCMDVMFEMAALDSPSGARRVVLNWVRRFLSCMRNPCLELDGIFQPVQNLVLMLAQQRRSTSSQQATEHDSNPGTVEEVHFLSTVAGLIRKEPFLINLFLPSHQHSAYVNNHLSRMDIPPKKLPTQNPLFDSPMTVTQQQMRQITLCPTVDCAGEASSASGGAAIMPQDEYDDRASSNATTTDPGGAQEFVCDCSEEDRFVLLDTLSDYMGSDNQLVVWRACEGALMLANLSSGCVKSCAAVKVSMMEFTERIGRRLAILCVRIPVTMETGHIEDSTVCWGYKAFETHFDPFMGRAELFEFLAWLDYANSVLQECCPAIGLYLSEHILALLFEDVLQQDMVNENAAFTLVLAAKIVHILNSRQVIDDIGDWLLASVPRPEGFNGCDESMLDLVIERAYGDSDILLPTLQFIESLLDNPSERLMHGMLFRFLNGRGYYDANAAEKLVHTWSDEEEERARRRDSTDEQRPQSITLAPTNILKVINHFLLLLPRQIMTTERAGTCYEEYVQDASIHYQRWINKTSEFDWPLDAFFTASDRREPGHSPDDDGSSTSSPPMAPPPSRPEGECNDSGICEETFYEGPLLRLLFQHIRHMYEFPYELNLAVIAIISKLAFFPHPFLHEVLLNPEIPVTRGSNTLWTSLQSLAKLLLHEVPRHEDFQKKIAQTAKRLLIDPPMIGETEDSSDPIFESLVVLEEFCKELAAIAFVKYHHATE